MITGCPNAGTEGCPYFDRKPPARLKDQQEHGCYANTDHTVPQRLAKRRKATPLEKLYVYSSANLRQLCIWEHDEKNRNNDEGYTKFPPVSEMIMACTVMLEPWELDMQEDLPYEQAA
jgi:hypothetical protein